jgi:hypothetical protein
MMPCFRCCYLLKVSTTRMSHRTSSENIGELVVAVDNVESAYAACAKHTEVFNTMM